MSEQNRLAVQRYRARNLEKVRARCRASALRRRAKDPRTWDARVEASRKSTEHIQTKNANRRARSGETLKPAKVRERMEIFGGLCAYCDADATSLDHIQPLARGGRNAISNCVPCCMPCNVSKGAQLLAEWRPDLLV